jgi:hypothetical protein
MLIPPLSVGEDKQTNVESLSIARGGQVQMCDRSRMDRNGRIELVSD